MPLTGLNATATGRGLLYTQGLTWTNWSTNASSATNSISNAIWYNWNQGTTAGTIVTAATNSWAYWNQNLSRAGTSLVPVETETPEHRAARAAREERWRQEEAIRVAAREAAARRAEALLLSNLDEEQRAQLAQHDWFLIDSKSGKKYRINRGRSANIDVIDEKGETVKSLCAHPRDNVPDADTMLAQVLMLRHEEDELLRIANVHGVHHGFRRGPVPAPIALPRAA